MNYNPNDTIVALATASGAAAIAVLRISGPKAIEIVQPFFYKNNQSVPYTIHSAPPRQQVFGTIRSDKSVLDEVLLTYFPAPGSYSGEPTIEIACHGSVFIQQQLLQLFLSNGARMAEPGEFTMRAYLNGKMDLSQAEAVADLINSQSTLTHKMALKQMRGGYSSKINQLRDQLIQFASLIELELDFSEEDVEFADRNKLLLQVDMILSVVDELLHSFDLGNVLKNGIPIAIVGRPNAGKSTLLNALLNEERAIVSDIPGTTRDTIEDQITINGVSFRFIDTAGLRQTDDLIEKIGVDRALRTIDKSSAVIYLFDPETITQEELQLEIENLKRHNAHANLIVTANKVDKSNHDAIRIKFQQLPELLCISAKQQANLDNLRNRLLDLFKLNELQNAEIIVTNARHAEALRRAGEALQNVKTGLNANIAGDLLALDIRHATDTLGSITGKVGSDDLLINIFTRFCIGK